MKIAICDICKLKDNKISEAKYRVGHTNALKIDTCIPHKDHFKGLNAEKFSEAFYALLRGAK